MGNTLSHIKMHRPFYSPPCTLCIQMGLQKLILFKFTDLTSNCYIILYYVILLSSLKYANFAPQNSHFTHIHPQRVIVMYVLELFQAFK